ncbi:MAG: hypothetical protein CMO55_25815 [Verrucomicrobiales bacterium]|nr:hypothetical protein [Verrucomicrobiales bacterium]
MPEKIAFALEPLSEKFGRVPLIKVLSDHGCFSSLLEAKQFVLDLADVAPQVVWVCGEDRGSFEAKLGDLDIVSWEVSKEEAERICKENKPVRGSIDLRIRSRDRDIRSDMIKELKARKLISGCRMGEDANEIYHWKDDRWYQDFHLTIFKESDVAEIEDLIGSYGYVVVRETEGW